MDIILTRHAKEKMRARGVRMHHVEDVLANGRYKLGRGVERFHDDGITLVFKDSVVVTVIRQPLRKFRETYRSD